MHRSHTYQVLKSVPEIDLENITGLIHLGWHHHVYAYKANWVVKVPHRPYGFLYSDKKALEQDLCIFDQEFPGLIPETKILASNQVDYHVILQKRIFQSIDLTPQMTPLLRSQVQTLLDHNREVKQRLGYSLDVLGGMGMTSCWRVFPWNKSQPYISNLVAVQHETSKQLLMVDAELLRLSFPEWQLRSLLIWVTAWITYAVNLLLLRLIFGVKL